MNCLSERQLEIFLEKPKALKNLRIQRHLKLCNQCQITRDSILANLKLEQEINSYLNKSSHDK
jgi:hypothetical protein